MTPARLFTTLLLCASMGCGFGSSLSRADLDLLCTVAGGIEKDGSVQPKKRLAAIGKRVGGKGAPALKVAWKAVAAAPVKVRKVAYNKMLADAGAKNFKCAPIERALNID